MLLLTLRGTPTLYQGDELGIGKVAIPPNRIRDPQDLRQPGLGLGRDGSRTPMPWDTTPQAGFTSAEPWLPLGADWLTRNVASETEDPGSMLSLYRRLLVVRRANPALELGDISLVPAKHGVLQYERRDAENCLLIALNLTAEPRDVLVPEGLVVLELLVSTIPGRSFDGRLAPDEGVTLRMTRH
jgi:alpha-glucosidase